MAYGRLSVGDLELVNLRDGVPGELLAVFRDDMYRRRVPGTMPGDPSIHEFDVVHELAAPGNVIADRLDVLGFTTSATMQMLSDLIDEAREVDYQLRDHPQLATLNAVEWVEVVRDALAAGPDANGRYAGLWPLIVADGFAPESERWTLRALLLADPDREVRLDLTRTMDEREIEHPGPICLDAQQYLRGEASSHAPLVVLTEGRSDIEILEPGLQLRRPHLTDVVRFMDFAQRPAGGAGPLVGTVRAFAAAGIANRVVALFDNDAAASEALRTLDRQSLPANIRVCQCPDLESLRQYPTLGPPTTADPGGTRTEADVNGLAGSIELYLGSDVLAAADGERPAVHWRSFMAGVGSYQGEVTNKAELQERFRRKMRAATDDPLVMGQQDWSGIDAVLDTILSAFDDRTSLKSAATDR